MNGVIGHVWGMGKNFKVCRYAFSFIKKLQVEKVCQRCLLYTSLNLVAIGLAEMEVLIFINFYLSTLEKAKLNASMAIL